MEVAKAEYERVVLGPDLTPVSSYVVELERIPEVMCSGAAQTTHDFTGSRIADLNNWERHCELDYVFAHSLR